MTSLDTFTLAHIGSGRSLIGCTDEGDLAETPDVWLELYERHRDAVLAYHVERTPGSRPEAWHQFEAPALPAQQPEEPEAHWLERIGQIDDDERAAILAKARELIRYNSGRDPNNPSSHFVPDTHGHIEFATDHDLLEDSELPAVF